MATNSIGAGKVVISASVPEALAREIERRAKVLQWTKSKYVGTLLLDWYHRGCPPVSEGEAVLIEHRALIVAEEQTQYQPPSKSSKKQTG